jgi:hypothetical protein
MNSFHYFFKKLTRKQDSAERDICDQICQLDFAALGESGEDGEAGKPQRETQTKAKWPHKAAWSLPRGTVTCQKAQ